jgi:predicted NUDIX family NTP pyrophosphohydrolase
MPRTSAGLLMYRRAPHGLEVLLVHPGGPFWSRRDAGAWSIPKGELNEGEDALVAAYREFTEETGSAPPAGDPLPLGEVRLRSRKRVLGGALEGDFDPADLVSNLFEMEWPPKTGRTATFPEVDRCGWFTVEEARRKLLPRQVPLLEALVEALGG